MGDEMKIAEYSDLLRDIRQRIRDARYEALKAVNKELIELYRDIGQMIVERQERETWGKSVVERLAKDLQAEFPGIKGFSASNLWRMRSFYESYTGNDKLAPFFGRLQDIERTFAENQLSLFQQFMAISNNRLRGHNVF